jgi:hypothetical protein
MSGYKRATVTISREEYDRLQNPETKKRFAGFLSRKSHADGDNEFILNLMRQLEARESELHSVLGSLSQNSTQYDNGLIENLLTQNAYFYEDLLGTLNRSSLDMSGALNAISTDFFQAMQEEREIVSHNLQALVQTQTAQFEAECYKAEAAQQWLNGCAVMFDFIENQFLHERFMPGYLNKIRRNFYLADNNLENGFYEASLQLSQQIYLELSYMSFELEQITLQWQMYFESTLSEVKDLILQMVTNGKVNAIGLQGEILPDLVDLNYWTNGRFSQLLDHTRQLSENIIQDQDILTTGDFDRIYNQIIPSIRTSFESLISHARWSAINSQLRMNIAEKALHALENHGFCLDAAGYSENDMRAQFNAHLASPDGSEITIEVVPTQRSDEELSNDLVVITTHPFLKTEHEARMHWDELSETLSQYNLNVSRPQILSLSNSGSFEETPQRAQVEQQFTQAES